MKVVVAGGRRFNDFARAAKVLDTLPIKEIAQGGAFGADEIAAVWASSRRVSCYTYRATWSLDGPAAGPLRNERMLVEFQPDLVVAFPGGKGTADLVRRAKKKGIRILEG